MIDIAYLRTHPQVVKDGAVAKQANPKLVDEVLSLDKKRREIIGSIQALRTRRNEIAKRREPSEEGKKIKEELKVRESKRAEVEENLKTTLLKLPNPPAADVKTGKDESENEILRQWGKPKQFDFKVKDHLELGEQLNIIDVERAAKVSGSRFSYLKGDLVLLEFALIKLAFETLLKEGFTPAIPPVLIKEKSMQGMGYLEHGGRDDMYFLQKDGLFLVGTSEQSIGPMHADEILNEKLLPLRYLGFSACFRRESGSYGRDTRGILRVHQFNKLEMFSFTKPEEGDKEHEFLLSMEEKLMRVLEIPYRVIKMCSGDLGAPAARKYDLEAWMPGQNKYREVTSTSTTTDYQARRLNIKYKVKGKTDYVHMLNGTAFSERPLIAILENYQQKDGRVAVPKVLQSQMGKKIIQV